MLVVVMGVCGCGKTSVGGKLAELLGWKFAEGDAYHPAANVEKMRSGQPLTDGDRWPWLDKIALDLKRWGDAGESAVVACSALKRAYRERLRDGASFGGAEVRFVHLRLDIPTLRERMLKRADHFMPVSLIESQFEALEPPGDEEACLDVDAVDGAPDVIAGRVAARLQTQ